MMASFSVSTWSLHRQLGRAWYVPTDGGLQNRSDGDGAVALMDVPRLVASHGIHQLEVCHFHFPSVEKAYLDAFCSELNKHGVTFYGLLIDTGDITHPDEIQRTQELDLVKSWIEVAGHCGAKQARVVAGEAEASDKNIALSANNLNMLGSYAEKLGVHITTENFKKLTQRSDAVLAILDQCDYDLGLCTDFGNFKGEHKYQDLAQILPRATTVHAKADYDDGVLNQSDFSRCMTLAVEAGFEGPYVLIFSDEGEEWPYLHSLKAEISTYLS